VPQFYRLLGLKNGVIFDPNLKPWQRIEEADNVDEIEKRTKRHMITSRIVEPQDTYLLEDNKQWMTQTVLELGVGYSLVT